MKIISKFKDYYDYMAYLGIDPKIVYVRHSFYDHVKINLLEKRVTNPYWRAEGYSTFWLVVCNKYYSLPILGKVVKTPAVILSTAYELVSPELYVHDYNSWINSRRGIGSKITVEEFSRPLKCECEYPICTNVDLNPATGELVPVQQVVGEKAKVLINPNLSRLGLTSIIKPEVIWQDLMMFIAPTEPKLVEVEDKYKIIEHGMDETSFRKDKHQSKPRGGKPNK